MAEINYYKPGGLQLQKYISLQFWNQAHASSEGSREESFPALLAPGGCRCSLPCATSLQRMPPWSAGFLLCIFSSVYLS